MLARWLSWTLAYSGSSSSCSAPLLWRSRSCTARCEAGSVLRPRVGRVVAWGLVLATMAVAAVVVAADGGPNHLAREVWAEFRQPAPTITADPDSRLFDVSSLARYQQWHVAGQMVEDHVWLGGGAGGYEALLDPTPAG